MESREGMAMRELPATAGTGGAPVVGLCTCIWAGTHVVTLVVGGGAVEAL